MEHDASGVCLAGEVPGGAAAHTDFSASGLPKRRHCSPHSAAPRFASQYGGNSACLVKNRLPDTVSPQKDGFKVKMTKSGLSGQSSFFTAFISLRMEFYGF